MYFINPRLCAIISCPGEPSRLIRSMFKTPFGEFKQGLGEGPPFVEQGADVDMPRQCQRYVGLNRLLRNVGVEL